MVESKQLGTSFAYSDFSLTGSIWLVILILSPHLLDGVKVSIVIPSSSISHSMEFPADRSCFWFNASLRINLCHDLANAPKWLEEFEHVLGVHT